MNKNGGFIFWQNNVGLAGQFFIVQPVTKALCMQKFPHVHLGFVSRLFICDIL
jgi:hypothetical protein